MAPLHNPRFVATGSARLSALILSIVLVAGNLALCAGWESSAAARMACCVNSKSCPMHQHAGSKADAGAVTQHDADRCCASSESQQRRTTTSDPGNHLVAAVPGPSVQLSADTLGEPRIPGWRVVSPSPPRHVATHVLLSIFLI